MKLLRNSKNKNFSKDSVLGIKLDDKDFKIKFSSEYYSPNKNKLEVSDAFRLIELGVITKNDGKLFTDLVNTIIELDNKQTYGYSEFLLTKKLVDKSDYSLFSKVVSASINKYSPIKLITDKIIDRSDSKLYAEALKRCLDYEYTAYSLFKNGYVSKGDGKVFNDLANMFIDFEIKNKNSDYIFDYLLLNKAIDSSDKSLFTKAVNKLIEVHPFNSYKLLLNRIITKDMKDIFEKCLKVMHNEGYFDEADTLYNSGIISYSDYNKI